MESRQVQKWKVVRNPVDTDIVEADYAIPWRNGALVFNKRPITARRRMEGDTLIRMYAPGMWDYFEPLKET